MNDKFSKKKILQKSFSLVEVLLSLFLLSLCVSAIVGAIIYGQGSAVSSGNRIRAAFLAEEGLEAVKNIKDQNFFNLDDGEYGLSIEDNHWKLSENEDSIDIFKRKINISSIDDDTKKIVSTVTWDNPLGQNNSISLTTYLTDWTSPYVPIGDFFVIDVKGANVVKPAYDLLTGIILKNTSSNRDFAITKIQVSWVPSNQNIQGVYIGDTLVWSENGPGTPRSSQPSGTILDIQNYTLIHGTENELKLDFTGNMKNGIFTIVFYLSDGSTKTVSGIGPV